MNKYSIILQAYRETTGKETKTMRFQFSEQSEHIARRRVLEDQLCSGWFVRSIEVEHVKS